MHRQGKKIFDQLALDQLFSYPDDGRLWELGLN